MWSEINAIEKLRDIELKFKENNIPDDKLNDLNELMIQFFKSMSSSEMKNTIYLHKTFERVSIRLLVNINHSILSIIANEEILNFENFNAFYIEYLDILDSYFNSLRTEIELVVDDVIFLTKEKTDYLSLLSLYGISYLNIN
jgi:hypothetical protein